VGFYNYIGVQIREGGPNPLADWVPWGSIFASGFGPGGPNLLGHRRRMWVEFVVGSRPCSEGFSLAPRVFPSS